MDDSAGLASAAPDAEDRIVNAGGNEDHPGPGGAPDGSGMAAQIGGQELLPLSHPVRLDGAMV